MHQERRIVRAGVLFAALVGTLCITSAFAQALPPSFEDVVAVSALDAPTVVRVAPNGKIFVAEKHGVISVFTDASDTTATEVFNIEASVIDPGLSGLAVDPAFPTRPYLYALYATNVCPIANPGCSGAQHLVRITLGSDDTAVATTTVVAGSCADMQDAERPCITDITVGPDGALYYIDAKTGTIHRVREAETPPGPVLVAYLQASPASGTLPLTVAFAASSTAAQGQTLVYDWDLNGDGMFGDATSTAPTYTYVAAGTIVASLRITNALGAQAVATTTVEVGEAAGTSPVAAIVTPATSTQFSVGDTIAFSGEAVDSHGAALSPAAFHWKLFLHSCAQNDPLPCPQELMQEFAGVSQGTLTVPNHEYPMHLELQLVVTDDVLGTSTTVSRMIDPKTAALSLVSVPSGLQLTVGSTSQTTPFTRTVVNGAHATVSASAGQTLGGMTQTFLAWSDSGAQTHEVIATTSLQFTASFVDLSASPRLLSMSSANSRYFATPDGKPVYLTGSHTWNNGQDIGDTNPPIAFDYSAYLNFMKSYGNNFMRYWAWEQPRYDSFIAGDTRHSPVPYQRTGPGMSTDGEPKFDLTQFNPAYFDRLRRRVVEAGQKGIYTGVMLFQGWSIASKNTTTGTNPWLSHPYNANNNINNINGGPGGSNNGYAIETLAIPAITDLQKAYIRKVVDTVNDLDNVLYEITNEGEGNASTTAWQYAMVNYIKSYEATKPKQHPVGMTSEFPGGLNADLFNGPADWVSPNSGANDQYAYNPPEATGTKVIINDTDHLWGVGGDIPWVWRSFLRGLNVIYMDGMDQTNITGAMTYISPDSANFASVRTGMRQTSQYAARLDLAHATPMSSLASSGYALAEPGQQYLVFMPVGSSTLNLSGLGNTMFAPEWLNTATNATTTGALVQGGSSAQLFTAPFSGAGVLFLTKTNTPPPPPSVPMISSFTASPQTISSGSTSTLSWVVSGATLLAINQGINAVTGTSKIVSPSATTTYTLTASNATGTTTAQVTVNVNTVTPPPPTIPVAGLLSHYSFSSTSINWSTMKVTDLVGSVLGTLSNMSPTNATTSGKVGQALTFGGTSYVNLGTPTTYNFGTAGSFTIASWFKTSGIPYQRIFHSGFSGCTKGAMIMMLDSASGKALFGGIGGPGGSNCAGIKTANGYGDNLWHHTAWVFDQSAKTIKVYVDGALAPIQKFTGVGACLTITNNIASYAGCSGINADASSAVCIGRNCTANSENWNGQLDEMRVYSRVLTAPEVNALYQAENTGT